METLSRYIPVDRKRVLAAGGALPTSSSGGLLYADISGFTPLTEALFEALGPRRGADELGAILDELYDKLTSEIGRFGGSVVLISGDSLTCWYDRDDGSRAVASALACHAVMRNYAQTTTPSGIPISLAIKLNVLAGSVHRFVVGDPQIQRLDVLAGELVDRLMRLADVTEKGEILAGADLVETLGDRVRVLGWCTDRGLQERAAFVAGEASSVAGECDTGTGEPEEDLPELEARTWVLPPIYDRVKAGQGIYLSELRLATPMFVKFTGLDFERDPQAGEKLDRFIVWTQRILSSYGGYTLSLSMDKGTYMFCIFGVPVAHDDDRLRAVTAATELVRATEIFDFVKGVQIGITYGRIHCGSYGGTKRTCYSANGTMVNMAARLMTKAEPGQILLSDRVVEAVGSSFEVQSLGQAKLKGIEGEVKLHRLGRSKSAATGTAGARKLSALRGELAQKSMVGRVAERELITREIEALRAGGAGNVVIVEGEAGIGKSRLVAQMLKEADARDVSTLLAVGDAIEHSTLYHAWRPVFHQLFDMDAAAAGLEARRERVLAELAGDEEALRFAPLLNAVLPVDLPENEVTSQMDGSVRQDNTEHLLARLLKTLAARRVGLTDGRPVSLMLVIEDAHWLDPQSWSLANRIHKQVRHCLMLVATRPISDPVPLEYKSLRAADGVHHLALQNLPFEDTVELIKLRLAVDKLPQVLVDVVRDKAEGHPFFSEEIVYALRDSGQISIEAGVCKLPAGTTAESLNVPDTVEGVVTSRMDILSLSQQLTLKVASVIGRAFSMRALSEVFPVSCAGAVLLSDLDTLVRLDLTPVEAPEPNSTYIFKHVITQEVAYGLMVSKQRRELHEAVARWYERTYADDLRPHYQILAHHWGQAEVDHKAVEYLEQSAENALTQFANDLVIANIKRCETIAASSRDPRLMVDDTRRALWYRYLGDACRASGKITDARQYYPKAVALQGKPLPETRLGIAIELLLTAARQYLYLKVLPKSWIRKPDSMRASILERAVTWEHLAHILYFTMEPVACLLAAMVGANIAEEAGPSPELARAYSSLFTCFGSMGKLKLSAYYERVATGLCEQVNELGVYSWYYQLMSVTALGQGRFAKAEANAIKGQEVDERLGAWKPWEDVTWLYTSTMLFWGRLDRSWELGKALEASGLRRSDPHSTAIARLNLAENAMRRGRSAEAWDLVQSVIATFDKNTGLLELIRAYGDGSLLLLRLGRREEAWTHLQKYLEVCKGHQPSSCYVLEGYASAAEAGVRLAEEADQAGAPAPRETLLKAAEAACSWMATFAGVFRIGIARAHLWTGRLAELRNGSSPTPIAEYRAGLDWARQLQMPYDEALLCAALERQLPQGNTERGRLLTRARDVLEGFGASDSIGDLVPSLATRIAPQGAGEGSPGAHEGFLPD